MATSGQIIAVVTGSTSGLGEQITRELLARKVPVVGLGRRASTVADPLYHHLAADLSGPISRHVMAQLQDYTHHADSIILVNNAGTVTPVAGILEVSWDEWRQHYALNVEAPLQLTQSLLKKPNRTYRLGHISSGAALKPYAGWGAYCSGKAALNMAMQVLQEELGELPEYRDRLWIMEYQPGPVATPMQAVVRASQSPYFTARGRFQQLHETNALHPVADVARDFVTKLLDPKAPTGYRVAKFSR